MAPEPVAATSSSDAANSTGAGVQPWWNQYKSTDVLAWDSEHVAVIKGQKIVKGKVKNICETVAATVDVVNTALEPVLSKKVFHAPGTFLCNSYTRAINGFTKTEFADETLPSLDQVRDEVKDLFRGKLVVTCGGISDYHALNLAMNGEDFDTFDLQSHWFIDKVNEHGVTIREQHSLRSLANYYLKDEIQTGRHTSLDDAIATMKLFEVYKRVKLVDDPENAMLKVNECRAYNNIPVVIKKVGKK